MHVWLSRDRRGLVIAADKNDGDDCDLLQRLARQLRGEGVKVLSGAVGDDPFLRLELAALVRPGAWANTPSQHRLAFLTDGPVLETLLGAHRRVAAVGLEDQMILTAHFGCRIGEVPRHLWQIACGRRRTMASR